MDNVDICEFIHDFISYMVLLSL